MTVVPPKPTDFRPGQRVRLRSDVQPDIRDRSGYITVVGNWLIHVQLDNSGQIVGFKPEDLLPPPKKGARG
jgi:hypothetical protein